MALKEWSYQFLRANHPSPSVIVLPLLVLKSAIVGISSVIVGGFGDEKCDEDHHDDGKNGNEKSPGIEAWILSTALSAFDRFWPSPSRFTVTRSYVQVVSVPLFIDRDHSILTLCVLPAGGSSSSK